MPHHDGLPLVFQFPEEDTQPESQEHKALWDELELALREDVAPVPAPVPAPVATTAPAPIPMALMGWEPHIVAELDATGFHEVPANFHAPVHLPAHAPARALTRTPVPVPVHLAAHAPARALMCAPVPVHVHTNVCAAPLPAPVPRGCQCPLSGMDGRRRPLPCTNASRLLPPVEIAPKARTFGLSLKLGQRPGVCQQRRKTPPSPSVSGPTTHRAWQRSRFPPRDAPAAAA